MEKAFMLWSTTAGGWLTAQGTYTSERRDAKVFNTFEASTLCITHTRDGKLGMLPVRKNDVDTLLEEEE